MHPSDGEEMLQSGCGGLADGSLMGAASLGFSELRLLGQRMGVSMIVLASGSASEAEIALIKLQAVWRQNSFSVPGFL